MHNRVIPSMQALCFSTRTTLNDLSQYTASVPRQLYAEAVRHELLPSGPLLWIYEGADGKAGTVFKLDIALPVSGPPAKGSSFKIKTLPVFKCVAGWHHGGWDCLYETYERLIDGAIASGQKPSGFSREQYLHMDYETPANNITEVQLGI
jgi:effector-binding domain-containing protein